MTVSRMVRRYHRLVHGGEERALVWFRVHVPRGRLWGDDEVEPVSLDPSTLQVLADGLRVDGVLTAVAPPPRPASTLERSYAGLASLLRLPTHCLVGVPDDAADRMPWAAAACGLLAARLGGPPPGTRVEPGPITVSALPGWMVGTDVYGVPVVLHLPPGTTTLLRGGGAGQATQIARTIAPSGRVVGQDVVIVDSVPAWRAAWHPQRCRVVVSEPDAAGAAVDVTVDLDARIVTSGGAEVGFTPLPLRW